MNKILEHHMLCLEIERLQKIIDFLLTQLTAKHSDLQRKNWELENKIDKNDKWKRDVKLNMNKKLKINYQVILRGNHNDTDKYPAMLKISVGSERIHEIMNKIDADNTTLEGQYDIIMYVLRGMIRKYKYKKDVLYAEMAADSYSFYLDL